MKSSLYIDKQLFDPIERLEIAHLQQPLESGSNECILLGNSCSKDSNSRFKDPSGDLDNFIKSYMNE